MMLKGNMLYGTVAVLMLVMLLVPMQVLAAGDTQQDMNDTVPDTAPSNPIFSFITWAITSTGSMINNVSSFAQEQFGIDQSIFVMFMLVIFILMIKYKANTYLFWGLIIAVLFIVASGAIPLGSMLG